MKRALRGNGSISQLASGKWLVKVPVGKTSKGKTRYVSRKCESKSEARRRHSELLVLRQSQMLVAGPRQTLQKYATEVFLNGNDRISDRTRDGYFRNLRKHAFPIFGSRCLSDVRSQELELFFSQLRKDHSASTVNNVRVALSKVFATAMRHELVPSNPVARTQKAKQGEFDKTQVRLPWSKEELLSALQAAKDTPMEAFLNLALATGMRLGELLGLRWIDIDFKNMTAVSTGQRNTW
jgi:integrase